MRHPTSKIETIDELVQAIYTATHVFYAPSLPDVYRVSSTYSVNGDTITMTGYHSNTGEAHQLVFELGHLKDWEFFDVKDSKISNGMSCADSKALFQPLNTADRKEGHWPCRVFAITLYQLLKQGFDLEGHFAFHPVQRRMYEFRCKEEEYFFYNKDCVRCKSEKKIWQMRLAGASTEWATIDPLLNFDTFVMVDRDAFKEGAEVVLGTSVEFMSQFQPCLSEGKGHIGNMGMVDFYVATDLFDVFKVGEVIHVDSEGFIS
ncbi:hypothetical protein [Vibrio phage vB_VmeM-Yong XC32]|nr:hypothetical protein [Vibrio phage vB_VmeM-Yong XC31]QAX96556.1 hypothetical protein [Vibrio phage vB_VmeM-Yong XC32]QAX96874.1 hypothetical protein [Vibrio phage vB_VmeM-Yong MS31]QAX97179.1 hypothetical protein [Vibrio phage vB_VmeM-Yong MS32]